MSERFYTSLPLRPGPVELTGAEAHHLATVCRLGPGDAVCLFNGDGREYPAVVRAAARRTVQLEVLTVATPPRELPFALEVAAPLPRGDRGQFLVEKLTELGVTSFVPLSSARSVVHPREGKIERLHRHVVEASKQCGRNVLMRVGDLEAWDDYCRRGEADELRLLGDPGAAEAVGLTVTAARVRVAVGPEGGFTDAEAARARDYGWRPVSLGPRILRIETAALALAVQAAASYRPGPAGVADRGL